MLIRPPWLEISDRTLWPTIHFGIDHFGGVRLGSAELDSAPYAAILHLKNCLALSQKANESVSHAVAIALVRQCVEAVTVLEAGLQQRDVAAELLGRWLAGKATAGQLRSELDKVAWPRYGTGLWSEPWSEFFGNLARAVQPFAHYGIELMQWQFAVRSAEISGREAKSYFLAQVGGFDPEKAARVTLLHSLIGWAVGRVFLANGIRFPVAHEIPALTHSLRECEYLERGVTDWSRQFWPHILDRQAR